MFFALVAFLLFGLLVGGIVLLIIRSQNKELVDNSLRALAGSVYLRIFLMGLLVLLSQIPMLFVDGIIGERQISADRVARDIAQANGESQTLIGPYLVVPYEWETTRRESYEDENGDTKYRDVPAIQVIEAVFLPQRLEIDGMLDPEMLERSIYRVLTYRGQVSMRGQFSQPDFSRFARQPSRVLWDQAYTSLSLSDMRTLDSGATIKVGGMPLELNPGGKLVDNGLHGFAQLPANPTAAQLAFEIELGFRGQGNFNVAPLAMENRLQLSSTWPSPSFTGAVRPTDTRIDENGFTAIWSPSGLARSYPQAFEFDSSTVSATRQFITGVSLFERFGTYGQIDRATKYSLLIVGLTFMLIFVVDQSGNRRMHGLQYLVVGGGMTLFYLLLLSISEVLGFTPAFAIGAGALSVSIAAYIGAAIGSAKRAAVVFVTLVALYAILYSLLNLEDYALLVGSVLLFIVLLAIMFVTRRMNVKSA